MPGRTSKPAGTERAFLALFLLLLGYLILYPYGTNAGLPFLMVRVFGIALMALSIYAVSFRRLYMWIGLLLAVPALAQRILLSSGPIGALSTASISFGLVFDLFIIVVLFRRVFMTDEPTREMIFGALCIYLLVGFGFSSIYGMLVTLQPHAFYLEPTVNAHEIPDRFDLIYFSFGTVTCVGASGITPASTQARSISVIEALLGVLYLAVLISRLLNSYQMNAVREKINKNASGNKSTGKVT